MLQVSPRQLVDPPSLQVPRLLLVSGVACAAAFAIRSVRFGVAGLGIVHWVRPCFANKINMMLFVRSAQTASCMPLPFRSLWREGVHAACM